MCDETQRPTLLIHMTKSHIASRFGIVEIILLHVKRRQAYVTKYNLNACLIVIGHRLDTDELYNICHPNMYMKHGL